jgi:hypothetical protein
VIVRSADPTLLPTLRVIVAAHFEDASPLLDRREETLDLFHRGDVHRSSKLHLRPIARGSQLHDSSDLDRTVRDLRIDDPIGRRVVRVIAALSFASTSHDEPSFFEARFDDLIQCRMTVVSEDPGVDCSREDLVGEAPECFLPVRRDDR